jgi:predicted RNase H-like HicB family nuclease
MFKYSINLTWSEEDSCYVATVAEFPDLSAFGESPEDAVEEAKTAVEGFLKVYVEDGCPVPRPKTLKTFSGQTRLRLPKSLHSTLHQEADREGVSLNTYIINLLSERHFLRQVEKGLSELKSCILSNMLPTGEQALKARSDMQVQFLGKDHGLIH